MKENSSFYNRLQYEMIHYTGELLLDKKNNSAVSRISYFCETCNSEKKLSASAPAPNCCGKPMSIEKLSQCTIAQHPEMVRNEYDDEPCDDNRASE
jgi:hypothetical protein